MACECRCVAVSVCYGVCNPLCVSADAAAGAARIRGEFHPCSPTQSRFLSNIPTSASPPHANAAACLILRVVFFPPLCVCRSSRSAGAGMESSLSEALKTG